MKITIVATRKALSWGFGWLPEQDSNLRPTAYEAPPGRRQTVPDVA
jgi:hypothetical protein